MPAEVILAIVLGCCLVLIGSLFMEALLNPRPPLQGRPAQVWLIHTGIGLLTYGLELLLFRRPYFAAVMALSTLLLLVVVSNVKRASLKEVFLFQDYEYFLDLLRHPRLYLPFFGVGKALLGLGLFLLALKFGMGLEIGLVERLGLGAFLATLLLLGILGWVCLRLGLASAPFSLSFQPEQDLQNLGFISFMTAYALAEKQPIETQISPYKSQTSPRLLAELPHLIVVQSESFFDPRRLHPSINPSVFSVYDAIKAQSVSHGRLIVPAWGANTVRTEFAFLSGLRADALGVHRFNPYRAAPRFEIPTLAKYLKSSGYRILGIHPYNSAFYGRDSVLPRLGFDEFIHGDSFQATDRFGPYVGDLALAERVCRRIENAKDPLFIFVISMENHGPLHWEQAGLSESLRFYGRLPEPDYQDLTVYLRHLENAFAMMEQLTQTLKTCQRDGWLCWYGDHVPILEKLYKRMCFNDGRTDYLLWHKSPQDLAEEGALNVEELGTLLLLKCGLMSVNSLKS